jgi:hypothetical protein
MLSPTRLEFRRTFPVKKKTNSFRKKILLFLKKRYPYYGIRLLNKEYRVMTWLRYTLWIILYPLGAFLEGQLFPMKIL